MKHLLPLIVLALTAGSLSAQSKKVIRENGIAGQTVQEYFLGEGFEEPVVESIERYNREGELIEVKEMNKRGELKRWEKYVYNESGQLTEELFLDKDGEVIRTEKTIYDGDLRVEKHFFDGKGRLFKKKVYEYEYFR